MAELAQPAFPSRQHQVVAGVDGRFPVLLARDGVHTPVVKASEDFMYILSEIPVSQAWVSMWHTEEEYSRIFIFCESR